MPFSMSYDVVKPAPVEAAAPAAESSTAKRRSVRRRDTAPAPEAQAEPVVPPET